jgi:hypothetical protein
MQVFYSDQHTLHNPPFELFDGGQHMPYLENPERMERILSALKNREWAHILEPDDFGLEPVLAVHDADYVDFYAPPTRNGPRSRPATRKKRCCPPLSQPGAGHTDLSLSWAGPGITCSICPLPLPKGRTRRRLRPQTAL